MSNDIPEELKKFIYKYIESLTQLEVLLYLYKNQPDSFNASTVAQEMRTSTDSVAVSLSELTADGLLNLENPEKMMYKYYRGNKEDNCIRQLEFAYQNFRHTLITLIFSKPSDNIRSFADAFKFKKDENDG